MAGKSCSASYLDGLVRLADIDSRVLSGAVSDPPLAAWSGTASTAAEGDEPRPQAVPRPIMPRPLPPTIVCSSCSYSNDADANWCMECGSVLAACSTRRPELPPLSRQSPTNEYHTDSSVKREDGLCQGWTAMSSGASAKYSHCNYFQSNRERPSSRDSAGGRAPPAPTTHSKCFFSPMLHKEAAPHLYNTGEEACLKAVWSLPSHRSLQRMARGSEHQDISEACPFSERPPVTASRSAGARVCEDENESSGTGISSSRHWDTSSLYMWRKPSSLKRRGQSTPSPQSPMSLSHSVVGSVDRPRNQRRVNSLLNNSCDGDSTEASVLVSQTPPGRPQHCGARSGVVPTLPLWDLEDGSRGSGTVDGSRGSGTVDEFRGSGTVDEFRGSGTVDGNVCQNGAKAELLSLPAELLSLILLMLAPAELLCCMLVCRRLLQIATHPLLWKKITISQATSMEKFLCSVARRQPRYLTLRHCRGQLSLREVGTFFEQLSGSLKGLSLDACDFGLVSGDILLTSAVQKCPSLRKISVQWTQLSDRALLYAVRHCKRLEYVHLEHTPNITRDTLQQLIAKHKKWLMTLKLKGRFDCTPDLLSLCSSGLPSLHSLALSSEVGGTGLRAMAVVFPALRCLELQCNEVPERAMLCLCSLPLTHLSLSCLLMPSWPALVSLGNLLTLKHLAINTIDDIGVQALCHSRNLQLESLDLSTSLITAVSLPVIAVAMTGSLRRLKLNGCRELCHATSSIALLMGQCSRLEMVGLYGLDCAKDVSEMILRERVFSGSCLRLAY